MYYLINSSVRLGEELKVEANSVSLETPTPLYSQLVQNYRLLADTLQNELNNPQVPNSFEFTPIYQDAQIFIDTLAYQLFINTSFVWNVELARYSNIATISVLTENTVAQILFGDPSMDTIRQALGFPNANTSFSNSLTGITSVDYNVIINLNNKFKVNTITDFKGDKFICSVDGFGDEV